MNIISVWRVQQLEHEPSKHIHEVLHPFSDFNELCTLCMIILSQSTVSACSTVMFLWSCKPRWRVQDAEAPRSEP